MVNIMKLNYKKLKKLKPKPPPLLLLENGFRL
jgi:hypothetical protein